MHNNDEKRLLQVIKNRLNGWTYCINSRRVLSIFIAKARDSTNAGDRDRIFTRAVYDSIDDPEERAIIDACANQTLLSTNGESIGLDRLLEDLYRSHKSDYNENVLNSHISKCKGFKKNSDGQWYIPDCNDVNHSTHMFLWLIRDLESGDYGYWKVQAFADAGVDLSKWDQSINVDIKDKEKDKKTAPMREKRKAVKSREKKKVVTKKT